MTDRFLGTPRPRLPGAGGGRVLRGRQDYSGRVLDGSPVSRPFQSERQLVQVYDGGMIGAAPLLYYLTHPVLVTGTETEGGAATLTVDSGTTIPVVPVRGVPSVGDYLTAYAVGGRWAVEVGVCNCKVNVKCAGDNIEGATVTVLSGETRIASGTTDASGNVTLNIGSAGTYTVTVTASGYDSYDNTIALTCGETINIDLCDQLPCRDCMLPTTDLTATISGCSVDACGEGDGPPTSWSFTLTYNGSGLWINSGQNECGPDGGGGITFNVTLSCQDNVPTINMSDVGGADPCTTIDGECGGDPPWCITLASYSCDPVSLVFNLPATGGFGGCTALAQCTTLTITT